MSPGVLLDAAREALLLALVVSLPIVAAAALVGLIVAAFQAATQIQDPTIGYLPRLLAVVAALVFQRGNLAELAGPPGSSGAPVVVHA